MYKRWLWDKEHKICSSKKQSGAHAELLHKNENEQMQETANKKRATFEFDEDFHTELKIFASKKKTKMVDVVVKALRKYMDENE